VDARVTLCQDDLGTYLFRFLKSPACDGNGILGVSTSHPTAGTATERIGSVVRHFDKVGCDPSDDLSRLFVDSEVSPEIARIMVGHTFFSRHAEAEFFKEGNHGKDAKRTFLQSSIRGMMREGPKAIGTTRDHGFRSRRKNGIGVFLDESLVNLVSDIFEHAAAADFID
jgi:hypothetical protein